MTARLDGTVSQHLQLPCLPGAVSGCSALGRVSWGILCVPGSSESPGAILRLLHPCALDPPLVQLGWGGRRWHSHFWGLGKGGRGGEGKRKHRGACRRGKWERIWQRDGMRAAGKRRCSRVW